MPWTPFEHPQLGPVEIGGWKRMYTFRNPPPAIYLEEMAAANCVYVAPCRGRTPLRVRDLQVEAVGGGAYHISGVARQHGFSAHQPEPAGRADERSAAGHGGTDRPGRR